MSTEIADRRAEEVPGARRPDRYKWVALSNTTLGSFMAALDGSIVTQASGTQIRVELPCGS